MVPSFYPKQRLHAAPSTVLVPAGPTPTPPYGLHSSQNPPQVRWARNLPIVLFASRYEAPEIRLPLRLIVPIQRLDPERIGRLHVPVFDILPEILGRHLPGKRPPRHFGSRPEIDVRPLLDLLLSPRDTG